MRFARFHTIFGFQIPGKLYVLLVKGLPALLLLLCQFKAVCQCPPNIGFENGNFDRWVCSYFSPTQIDNFNVTPTGPTLMYHIMLKNTFPQPKDPSCDFPRNTPNSSNYSVRLGSGHYAYGAPPDGTDYGGSASNGGNAQRISYPFTIPSNKNDYAINFLFAVVLAYNNDSPVDEPRFTAKIYDYDKNMYLDCKTIEIKNSNRSIAFLQSTAWSYLGYVPWTSATINLSGMAGKKVALEFATNDVTQVTSRTCYAYVDVDENCTTPVTGNTYCKGDASITMKGPNTPGTYTWYTSDFLKALGRQNILTLSPAPAPGTKYALVINPTPGFGCTDTMYTTVQYSGNELDLQVKDTLRACFSPGADLTAASVTNGSSPDLTFSYYTNSYQTTLVPLPKHVQDGGLYYITATNTAGCRATKPVSVKINNPYIVINTSMASVCAPNSINLTDSSVILVSTKGLVYSYWKDSATTLVLSNPQAIAANGTYYIKGVTAEGCAVTGKVNVSILPEPGFTVATAYTTGSPATIDITALVDHTNKLQYSYWRDAQATVVVQKPEAVDSRGIYYIKGADANGCSAIKRVVTVLATSMKITNVFSPNNDGINDTWQIPYLQSYPTAKVEVYNRYGQMVFKSNGVYKPWDGKLNGKDLPVGTYYYIIKLNAQDGPLNGSISILK